MRLTKNDWRVLQAVERACREWDGYMPHGSPDWTAARRLESEQLIERARDYAECQDCREQHEGPAYKLTVWGARLLASNLIGRTDEIRQP